MRIKGKSMGSNEPPILISDLNGNIIYVNKKASHFLYPVKSGDSISKYVDLDYIKKISLFDKRIDVIVPKNCKFEKAVVKVIGTGVTKTVEVCFMNGNADDATDLMEDKKLFATYAEVIGSDVSGAVKLNDFAHKIVDCMHADLRFAYRKFNINEAEGDPELYANFNHLSAIAVGVIIALNEIEYRNPIEISIEEMLGEYVMKISVPSNTFTEAEGLHEISELYPRIAMRLMYITSLCDNDEIKYSFSVRPNKITSSFVVTELINKTGKFSFSTFGSDQMAFISYIINIFSPSDKGEEGQE